MKFDRSTVVNLTAALKYVFRKLPPNRDNDVIRNDIAEEMIAQAKQGHHRQAQLVDAGLVIVNGYLFPPSR